MSFKGKVFQILRNIRAGSFLSYKEVAKRSGSEKAYRVVANILAKNKDPNIPCHRVIRNDNLVGGYKGREDLDWMKAAMLLKEGAIGVIPTDTIYGICTSAFNRKSVEKVYKLRKRNPNKPCIILISSLEDLKKFNIRLTLWQKKILEKLWPGKISVVLWMQTMQTSRRLGGTNEDFIDLAWTNQNKISARSAFHSAMSAYKYLHRGTNSLAFRLPKNKLILKYFENFWTTYCSFSKLGRI
jgi:O-6-methylguanine DNA methyltransferase